MIEVKFSCSGCDAEAWGTAPLTESFVSITGRSYGFGSYRPDNTVRDVTPDGWVAYDPYTNVCYCQECWKQIEDGVAEDVAALEADDD